MLTTHFGLKNSYLPLKTQLKSFLSFSSPDFMLWCPSSSAALPLCPYLHYSHRTFCTALRLWRGWSAILPDCKLLGIFNSLLSPAPNTVSYLVSFQQIFLELMEKRKKKRDHIDEFAAAPGFMVSFLFFLSSHVYHSLFTHFSGHRYLCKPMYTEFCHFNVGATAQEIKPGGQRLKLRTSGYFWDISANGGQ